MLVLQKNPAEESSAVEVQLHKSVENTRVLIPRCVVCANAHRRVHNINMLSAILAPIVLLILWVAIGTTLNTQNSSITQAFTCYFPLTIPLLWLIVPLATRQYLKSIGAAPESGKKKHPEVISLLQAGYQMGHVAEAKPAAPTPAPTPAVKSSGDQPPQLSKLERLMESASSAEARPGFFMGDDFNVESNLWVPVEQEFESEFGWSSENGAWHLTRGETIGTMAAELTNPSVCLEALDEFQRNTPFTEICISANRPISITCNTKPNPTTILTGLDAGGHVALITAAQLAKPAGRKALEYHGMWVIPVRTPIIKAKP